MKKTILTIGLFSLVMVLTSFTSNEKAAKNINEKNTSIEINGGSSVGGNKKVDINGGSSVGGNKKVDINGGSSVGGNKKVD
ncbi:3-oxoacyl-ACP reductase [Flavobacterium restrictum]|uniref:3-oxoacyl-ACP reductase n=1 Tax=Flavobacterium restrictum TaxID=2594428 RepID=A0A553DY93_9FLAO|nr:3-oxoacyl-ACP reductase [Flavobacterium restrictum]TRX37737.1 3-oxoacyl-ACP reductase [Flavobacterium restrictum]